MVDFYLRDRSVTQTLGVLRHGVTVLTFIAGCSGVACSTAAEGTDAAEPLAAGRVYYFSDCQAGAAPNCVPGDNSNRGTSVANPKQSLSGFDVKALPAGTRLLFARGGAWSNFTLTLENGNATPTNPLVLDAYGTGAAPLFKTAGGNAIAIGGRWGNTSNDGGYTLRNLHLDGMGSAEWGVWLVQNVRNVTLDNVDVTGFKIGVHSSSGSPHGVTGLAVRNSRINRNRSMGMLGSYTDSVIENNSFEGNNFSGSSFNHAIYVSGGSRNIIRNNTFTANSAVDDVCLGGNVTVHGIVDGLLIEGNTIRQKAAKVSCYGFAVTAGYDTAEEFRNVVIRGNTIVNVGMTAIAVNSAPGVLVENNKVINTQDAQQYSIWIPANGRPSSKDAVDRDAIVRNNTVCLVHQRNSVAVSVNVPGSQVSNNTVITGSAALAKTCALQ